MPSIVSRQVPAITGRGVYLFGRGRRAGSWPWILKSAGPFGGEVSDAPAGRVRALAVVLLRLMKQQPPDNPIMPIPLSQGERGLAVPMRCVRIAVPV